MARLLLIEEKIQLKKLEIQKSRTIKKFKCKSHFELKKSFSFVDTIGPVLQLKCPTFRDYLVDQLPSQTEKRSDYLVF